MAGRRNKGSPLKVVVEQPLPKEKPKVANKPKKKKLSLLKKKEE